MPVYFLFDPNSRHLHSFYLAPNFFLLFSICIVFLRFYCSRVKGSRKVLLFPLPQVLPPHSSSKIFSSKRRDLDGKILDHVLIKDSAFIIIISDLLWDPNKADFFRRLGRGSFLGGATTPSPFEGREIDKKAAEILETWGIKFIQIKLIKRAFVFLGDFAFVENFIQLGPHERRLVRINATVKKSLIWWKKNRRP